MGAAFPTDFGAQYGGPILDTAMQRWVAAGILSEMMDCNMVGQHLAAMFGVMLAIPGVDIPDICYDPRGVPIAAAPIL